MKDVVVIDNLTKSFGGARVVAQLSAVVKGGEIVSVVAPSGAGKSTLLKILAGLEVPSSGSVSVNGRIVSGPTPDVGLVFQQPSAFPWLTVQRNIEFGLRLRANRGLVNDDAELRARALQVSRDVGLEGLLGRFPSQLSGGQAQRVAIARTLVLEPTLLLCDEPFSALDEISREELRLLLQDIHVRSEMTLLFVTHNIEEAAIMGSRVVLCSGPPLRLEREFEVSFPRPRTRNALNDPRFASLVDQLRAAFRELL